MNKICIVVFGKFSPVHKGHGKLFTEALKLHKITDNSVLKIYVTDSQSTTNPIPYDLKIEMITQYYPELDPYIQRNHSNNLFDVMADLDEEFSDIVIISGSDRTSKFNEILQKYNTKLYNFNSITSTSSGNRASDEYSSTNVRSTVIRADFGKFVSLMPGWSFATNKKYFKILGKLLGTVL